MCVVPLDLVQVLYRFLVCCQFQVATKEMDNSVKEELLRELGYHIPIAL